MADKWVTVVTSSPCRLCSTKSGGTPKPRALKRSVQFRQSAKAAADTEIWLALADRLEWVGEVGQQQRARDRRSLFIGPKDHCSIRKFVGVD